jgi:hypothetical protein
MKQAVESLKFTTKKNVAQGMVCAFSFLHEIRLLIYDMMNMIFIYNIFS